MKSKLIVLVSFTLVLWSCKQSEKKETVSKPVIKPNIVLILSDDQAWNDYGFMGHDSIESPHLDKLASQSVVFKRGYL
jgi:arylsulfatase A-like enzyme